jgi:hypothetical protein
MAALFAALSMPGLAAQATWEQELREMGYLILHISNINVVNGLNLTRDQAVKLRALALQVEAAADAPPALKALLGPEIEGVRKTYLELREVLLKGQPVSPELTARVHQARAVETKFIRSTLRSSPVSTGTSCVACHMAPREDAQPMTPTASTKALTGRAHMQGPYGQRGLAKVVGLSPQVEAVLTDAQKAVLGSFSCCLVPPQDLSDPVRAGQAESGSKELELLRKVRQIPDGLWPGARDTILKRVDSITQMVSPGATEARKATAREAVAKALDRARSLSDVEFELEKAELARGARAAIVPPQGDSPHKAAFFLLMPGASKVYARYLERLSDKKAEAASRPN